MLTQIVDPILLHHDLENGLSLLEKQPIEVTVTTFIMPCAAAETNSILPGGWAVYAGGDDVVRFEARFSVFMAAAQAIAVKAAEALVFLDLPSDPL